MSSLPSDYGIGNFGPDAYRFADFLADAGMRYWQILPLNPTSLSQFNSPYSCMSAFALNPLFISPDLLAQEGLIAEEHTRYESRFASSGVDFNAVAAYMQNILNKATDNFLQKKLNSPFESFCRENSYWLDNYALFAALNRKQNTHGWHKWPVELREREINAIKHEEKLLQSEVLKEKITQYLAFIQWQKLKQYCNKKGIRIIGDIPYYVQYHSADVWSNQELFKLDENTGKPLFVGGVPPDYFSRTGQLWGMPVYRWKKHEENNFNWWVSRIRMNLELYDIVRLDHFRAFVSYWEVPANEKTAINGEWVAGPSDILFRTLKEQLKTLPVFAEDLGDLSSEVRRLISKKQIPNMRVIQFGMGSQNPQDWFLPHNFNHNCVVYTGTHDNNTLRGWYRKELNHQQKKWIRKLTGKRIRERTISREMIRLICSSVADMVMIQLQDILNLDEKHRMNTPGTAGGNWEWRMHRRQYKKLKAGYLFELNRLFNRI